MLPTDTSSSSSCLLRKISSSLSFFTLKDSNGTTQLVANRDSAHSSNVLDALANVPVESVVLVQGSVRLRPQKAQRKAVSQRLLPSL